jgi:hypothetical protein
MNDSCGCCEASVAPTPQTIDNRPGLSAIAYRVGDYASFRQAMLEAISLNEIEVNGQTLRPLSGWTTRADNDYGIALLDMWAYVGDILTFYQERIANEAYLRTALFRDSVLRLAALLGYEPASGVAATAYLAFTVEEGETVEISPGLRVQSVPGQDEKPQKFETVESLTAVSRLNHFRVYAQPQADWPLTAGRIKATALGDVSHVAAGDRLAIFEPGTHSGSTPPPVEDKEIVDNQAVDWRQELTWGPATRRNFASSAEVYKWGRKFHLFGRSAPSTFFVTSVDANGDVSWQQDTPDYCLAEGSTLALDAVYDDLKENTELLVVARLEDGRALVRRASVSGAEQATAQLKSSAGLVAAEGTVTKITLSRNLPEGIDVRSAVVYELEGGEIELWPKVYPTRVSGDTVCAALADWDLDPVADREEAEGLLEKGRRILLEDGQGRLLATTVVDSRLDGDHLKITLDDAPSDALSADTAEARANVVLATHGETVADEVLGSGEAASAFQTFSLKKSPATFVPEAGAKNGAANTLEVRVDGLLWHEADTLYGQGADQRVFTTHVDDDGVMSVRFGDGQTGARLPTGRSNVVSSYRQGLGREGNVKASSLTTLLDRPVGLKSVTNPGAGQGGADPETLDSARDNAPNTVRTFDRIVSLRDFEDAARAYNGVAKARATWQWDGVERAVLLTVAGDDGTEIEAGSETHSNLVGDLDSRRDPNRKMTVQSFRPVAIQVEAAIEADGEYDHEEVRADALAALGDYLAFDNLDLGQPIHLSDLYRVLQGVEGVVAADVNRLQFKCAVDRASHGASTAPVQARLAIFLTELATIEDEATDLVVNVGLS